jgi:hypothetical protein
VKQRGREARSNMEEQREITWKRREANVEERRFSAA